MEKARNDVLETLKEIAKNTRQLPEILALLKGQYPDAFASATALDKAKNGNH